MMKELMFTVFSIMTLIGAMMFMSEPRPESTEEWNFGINIVGFFAMICSGKVAFTLYGVLQREYNKADPGTPRNKVRCKN